MNYDTRKARVQALLGNCVVGDSSHLSYFEVSLLCYCPLQSHSRLCDMKWFALLFAPQRFWAQGRDWLSGCGQVYTLHTRAYYNNTLGTAVVVLAI